MCNAAPLTDEEIPPIKHGSLITDRRSTFQPHLAPVVTPGQVQHVHSNVYDIQEKNVVI